MRIDKRLANKNFRINNFYKIVDKEKNLIVYNRNSVQKEFDKQRHYRDYYRGMYWNTR